jgi:hypothetical protein
VKAVARIGIEDVIAGDLARAVDCGSERDIAAEGTETRGLSIAE